MDATSRASPVRCRVARVAWLPSYHPPSPQLRGGRGGHRRDATCAGCHTPPGIPRPPYWAAGARQRRRAMRAADSLHGGHGWKEGHTSHVTAFGAQASWPLRRPTPIAQTSGARSTRARDSASVPRLP
eukprot:scaffold51279_cov58-Phaeocystis_antarctica.AAC.2